MDFRILTIGEPRIEGVLGIVARAHQERRRIQEEACIDSLTGMQNQNQWLACRNRVNADPRLHILRIDVNKLKLINDTYGHAVGDDYIAKVAEIIQVCCGDDISPRLQFRTGGDELTVVGPQDVLAGVMVSVQARCCHIEIRPGRFGWGISCGVGFTEEEADRLMYCMKIREGDGEKDAPAKRPQWEKRKVEL